MKNTTLFKMLLLTLVSFSIHLNAQTVSNNFANTMNDVFAGVDLNRVPHHLLTDYAMEFVDIRSYNGVNTANNYVHKGIYTSAYNTLLMARTKTNVPDLIHPNQFESNWKAARAPYTIALSGLYYKYSRIRENAHPNAITVSNNKLYDKYTNGVWQNPYETDIVFMITAPILKYNYKNMNVVLPNNLWYSNQDSQVQSIAVNFNDGNGFQTITMGQNTYVSYNNEGTYTWVYKLILTNGQILDSHSKLIVGNQTAPINNNIHKRLPNEPCTIGTLVNDFDQVEFQGTQQFVGVANSATIQIRYASGNPCDNITNPLIVAEGFESGLLGNENPLGDNDIDEFLDEARGPSIDLRNEIDNFDIIYVNWDNGRDDIRRNALLLEDIITWINSIKTTTNENVVLGQSMGGLIARYALVDMEQDPNQDHDTRLYVSHDAPHQGANIPISIQYLARHLADEFVSTPVGDFDLPTAGGGSVTISDINNVFNSIGTRQLLANNINGSFSLDNNAFNTFQADLQSKGYPQQPRNIAISNGSHCANEQELQALQELLYLSGDIEPTILLDTIINYFPLLSWVEGLGYVGLAIILEDPAYLAGLLPGRTNLNARFEAKSLPNVGQTANIYRGRIRITKKIDFLLFTLSYNINVTDRNETNPSTVQLPLDSYPGGAFNVTFDLSELNDIDGGDVDFLVNLNITARTADSFNFIPTTTALDVGSGSITLNNNDYIRVYTVANPPTGNRAIPFDNYTSSYNTNGTNERHISFNRRNGDWLAVELDNIFGNEDTFNCTWSCDGSIAITGSSLICDSSTFTFQDGPTSINWSLTPSNAGSISINMLNPNQITVTRSNSYNGPATINANASSPKCGSNTITKNVWFGGPNINQPTSVSGPNNLDPGQTGLFSINTNNFNNASSFTWVLFSNQFPNASQHFELNQVHNGLFTVKPDFDVPGGYYSVQARATNGCGFYPVSKTFYVEEGDGIPVLFSRTSNIYKIYPNPSSTTFNISLVDKTQQPLDSENIYGELLDLNGFFISRIDINDNKASVNANNLRKGIYILRIYYDGKSEGHQVIVE